MKLKLKLKRGVKKKLAKEWEAVCEPYVKLWQATLNLCRIIKNDFIAIKDEWERQNYKIPPK
jgi:hypothetical protein